MDPQIVDYHLQGLWGLAQKNTAAARDHFAYALRSAVRECDLYRGLAACDKYAGDDNVLAIYLTRRTFGDLTYRALLKDHQTSRATGPAPKPHDFEYMPLCNYDTQFFGVVFPIGCLDNLVAAAAAVHTNRGEFDKARRVLDTGPADGWAAKMAAALLYYRTQRWNDVVQAAVPLQNAAMTNAQGYILDEHDNVVTSDAQVPASNVLYQHLAYLMLGTAHAHLGNWSDAEAELTPLRASNYPKIRAEAHRVTGLIARYRGDEDQAQKDFAIGISLSRSEELVRAQSTRGETLRQTSAEMIDGRSSFWDVGTEPSLQDKTAAELDSIRAELLAEAEAELERQIGMTSVKEAVRQLRQTLRLDAELAARGTESSARTHHMMFMGPPGTGKTTIARVIAKILAGLGVCREPTFVEVTRKDLVGEHWGKSGPMTKKVIDSARGGVLFIDEAYDLVRTNAHQTDALGQEAVNALLTEMENHRDDLVVIIAGYEADLRAFLATNEGLASRFATTIRFESYAPEEIADIAGAIAAIRDDHIDDDGKKAIVDIARVMSGATLPNGKTLLDAAGNGRFARGIIEKAEGYKATRFADLDFSAMSDLELKTLTADDIRSAATEIYNKYR